MKIRTLAATAALSVALLPTAAAAQDGDCFPRLKAEMIAAGIPAAVAGRALDGLSVDPRVAELETRQPEFTQTFGRYFAASVSADRIAKGQQMLQRHKALLDQLRAEYGVQPEILMAFWGLETNYGGYMGDFGVIRSVGTLACVTSGRRSAFFVGELRNALRIVADNRIDIGRMRGSWAGAMGNMQFMPSTFMAHALDRDGDGRTDLWGSVPDALASAANYLKNIGWRAGQPPQVEVRLPAQFALESADGETMRSPREWSAMGVTQANGRPLAEEVGPGAIVLPAGARGPAFLLLANNRAVMTWNRSLLYSLAIGQLAQQIAGGPALSREPPGDDQPLARDAVLDLQRRLARLGFYNEDVDGLLGPRTRAGIRAFQRANGLPPDGHPTLSTLDRIRQAN